MLHYETALSFLFGIFQQGTERSLKVRSIHRRMVCQVRLAYGLGVVVEPQRGRDVAARIRNQGLVAWVDG